MVTTPSDIFFEVSARGSKFNYIEKRYLRPTDLYVSRSQSYKHCLNPQILFLIEPAREDMLVAKCGANC